MSTNPYDIEFKQGEKGIRNAVLFFEDGSLIDLTPYTVTFVMKDSVSGVLKTPITCTQGCTFRGQTISAARGGVATPFTDTDTAAAGTFLGEWVLTSSDVDYRVPEGDKFVQVKIWENVS